ncbi:MAG: hypothetical protein OEM78_10065 [Gammaproteobacteria bacterium]|nr:hypothetical protein [Gammaproteobacteria bacterium]
MVESLTLVRRGAALVRDWRFSAALIVLVIATLGIPVMAIDFSELSEFFDALTGEDRQEFTKLVALVLGAVFIGPLIIRVSTRGRIEIRESGIAFRSELPELLQSMQPDWDYTWGQVQDARLVRPMLTNPLMLPLQFSADGRTVTLIPWQWVDAAAEKGSLAETLSVGRKRKRELEKLVRQSPLITAFEQRGKLDVGDPIAPPAQAGGINASKTAQAVAVLFVALVLYFIIDMYFGFGEYYAGVAPWHFFVSFAVCGLGLAATMLHVAGHLSSQGKLMAMLFGIGMGLASYPFLLRVNAWTDPIGLQAYRYILAERDTWVAEEDVPDLVFDISSEYWEQFEPGDSRSFELRRGGLDFYQVNMRPVYAEQREFYSAR